MKDLINYVILIRDSDLPKGQKKELFEHWSTQIQIEMSTVFTSKREGYSSVLECINDCLLQVETN